MYMTNSSSLTLLLYFCIAHDGIQLLKYILLFLNVNFLFKNYFIIMCMQAVKNARAMLGCCFNTLTAAFFGTRYGVIVVINVDEPVRLIYTVMILMINLYMLFSPEAYIGYAIYN